MSVERDTHPHLLQCTAKWPEGEDLTARIWLTQPTLNAFSGLPYVHFLTQQRDLIHLPDFTVHKLFFLMFFFVEPSCPRFDRDTKCFQLPRSAKEQQHMKCLPLFTATAVSGPSPGFATVGAEMKTFPPTFGGKSNVP